MRVALAAMAIVSALGCSSGNSTPATERDAGRAEAGDADAADVNLEPNVDEASLGGACSATAPCAAGSTCADFHAVASGVPDLQAPRCAPDPPCARVTCPTGSKCIVAESNPIQIFCDR